MAELSEQTAARRNAGSEFLKECMADALLKLMETRDFDKITVREITNLANVGRATYFRHFNSKEDLLLYKIHLLWNNWAGAHQLSSHFPFTPENLTSCFEFIYSIRSINRLLMNADKLNVLLIAMNTELGITPPEDPYEFYCYYFITIGLAGVLTEWIKRDYGEPPKDLIECLLKTDYEQIMLGRHI